MPSTAAAGLDIHEWIRGLEAIPVDANHAEGVEAYVRTRLVCRASLEPYAFFHPKHYTRNLIHLSENYEVLALCWGPGNASTVHNHREQNCFVVMAEGHLESLNFRMLEHDPVARTCKLQPSTSELITRSQPGVVRQDTSEIHQIVNCPSHEQRALSVHVYSKPFDTCEVYCLNTGTYKSVKLTYWSVKGELKGGAQVVDPCGDGVPLPVTPCE